jgi:uncharacterized membrane protein
MINAVVAFIAVALTAIAIACRRTVMFIAAGFAFAILSFWNFSTSAETWDIYFLLAIFSIAMMLVMLIEAINIWSSERRAELKGIKQEQAENAKEKEAETKGLHPADKLRVKHGLPPSPARARRDENLRTGW